MQVFAISLRYGLIDPIMQIVNPIDNDMPTSFLRRIVDIITNRIKAVIIMNVPCFIVRWIVLISWGDDRVCWSIGNMPRSASTKSWSTIKAMNDPLS